MLQITFGLLLCLFLQANCEVIRTSETRNTFIPFYRLFTPYHIRYEADYFDTTNYNYAATAITFGAGNTTYGRLFKLPLVPCGILYRYADISVRITVGLDSGIRESEDSDPKFVISDGERGIGFEMRDETKGEYCRGVEGSTGDTLDDRRTISGSRPDSSIFPERFVLNLVPSRYWGSCYHAADSGLISPVTYTRRVYLDQGLYLEMYRESTFEEYVLNYIIVEIHEN